MGSRSAFCCLIIGIILIATGFFMLLNFDITEWNAQTIFKTKLKLEDVYKMIRNYNEGDVAKEKQLEHDFERVLNNLDHDSYLYLYCQSSKKEQPWVYHPKMDFPVKTTQAAGVTTKITTTTLPSRERLNEQLELEMKKFYLKSVYNIIICRSEKIYVTIIVIFTFIGSLFVIFASIKIYTSIYKCDIKSATESNVQNEVVVEINEEDAADRCGLIMCFRSLCPKSKSNRSAFNRYETSMIRPNSLILVNRKVSQDRKANEHNAPFIYEDLPAFYTAQNSQLSNNLNASFTLQNSFDCRNTSLKNPDHLVRLKVPSLSPVPPSTPVPLIFSPQDEKSQTEFDTCPVHNPSPKISKDLLSADAAAPKKTDKKRLRTKPRFSENTNNNTKKELLIEVDDYTETSF